MVAHCLSGTKRTAKGAAQYCDYGRILFVLHIKRSLTYNIPVNLI